MSIAQVDAAALEHVYATMYCLLVLAEAGGGGQVARVARIGQQELWPVIAHLGGSQQTFSDWRIRREMAGRQGQPRRPITDTEE